MKKIVFEIFTLDYRPLMIMIISCAWANTSINRKRVTRNRRTTHFCASREFDVPKKPKKEIVRARLYTPRGNGGRFCVVFFCLMYNIRCINRSHRYFFDRSNIIRGVLL